MIRHLTLLTFILVFSLSGIFIFLLSKDIRRLEKEIQISEVDVFNKERSLKNLSLLTDEELFSLEKNYGSLDAQLNMFCRYYGLTGVLNVDGQSLEGNVPLTGNSSNLAGIDEIPLVLSFYDIKEQERSLKVFKFINDISFNNPLEVLKIIQIDSFIQIKFKLYGRKV